MAGQRGGLKSLPFFLIGKKEMVFPLPNIEVVAG